jgi:hypothetical protein
MLRGFGAIAVVSLSIAGAAGCGGDSTSRPTGEGFDNLYLWQVGNCEAGTLTPVNPETGETQICGDVDDVSECVGQRVGKMVVRGNMAILISSDGTLSERMRFERAVNCQDEPSLSNETCVRFADSLGQYSNLYVGRMIDRARTEQLHPDGLWMTMDKPWPGVEGCGAEFEG